MKIEFTEEQELLKEMVHEFVEKEMRPNVKEFEEKGLFPEEIFKKLAGLGIMGMSVPSEYGGSNLDLVSSCIVYEEISRVCPSTSITLSVHNCAFCYPIAKFGSEAQKRRYLVPAGRGDFIGAFSLTEPGAGSDAQGIQTKAERKGNLYILNGTKNWITSSSIAGAFIVMAKTSPIAGSKSISAFIIDKDSPGLKLAKIEDKMGIRSSKTGELFLEDCIVPESNLLGEEGIGLKIAFTALDASRIGVAAQAVGIAQSAMEEAIKYSKERKAFGKSISEFQAIQFMISEMATQIEAARLLTYRAAYLKDQGKQYTKEASMAKLYASEIANRVVYNALQIHGAYGYSKEYLIEKLFRDARVTTIYEGTSEIQRIVIARRLLQ
ncbi:MAG: acyl-CoA dehydrogenase [Acidobacteriota bacterium]